MWRFNEVYKEIIRRIKREKRMKKTLPSVEISDLYGHSYNYTNTSGLAFSWTSPKAKLSKRKMVTDWHTCREVVCHRLREEIEGVKSYGIAKARLSLLVSSNRGRCIDDVEKRNAVFEKLEADLKIGISFINTIEAKLGWRPSRVYGVKETDFIYFVSGSSKWLNSPQMISLFTLILRIATDSTHEGKTKEVSSFEEFLAILKELRNGKDSEHLLILKKYLNTFIENYNDIFKNRDLSRNFRRKHLSRNATGFSEGISSLLLQESADIELVTRWRKILKKKGETDEKKSPSIAEVAETVSTRSFSTSSYSV